MIADSLWRRVIVGVVILAILGGLFVGYGSLGDAVDDPHPSDRIIVTQYDAYVGETDTISGTVIETEPVTILVEYQGGTQAFTVTGSVPAVKTGDHLSVYGDFQPGYTIASEGAIVQTPGNRVYMYAISVVALGVLAVLGYRTWTVDTGAWVLRPQEDGDA